MRREAGGRCGIWNSCGCAGRFLNCSLLQNFWSRRSGADSISPRPEEMKVHLEKTGDEPVQCSWFDPSDGKFKKKEIWPPCPVVLRPPDAGHDWVAVLDF